MQSLGDSLPFCTQKFGFGGLGSGFGFRGFGSRGLGFRGSGVRV